MSLIKGTDKENASRSGKNEWFNYWIEQHSQAAVKRRMQMNASDGQWRCHFTQEIAAFRFHKTRHRHETFCQKMAVYPKCLSIQNMSVFHHNLSSFLFTHSFLEDRLQSGDHVSYKQTCKRFWFESWFESKSNDFCLNHESNRITNTTT